MNDLRDSYRHYFSPDDRLRVDLFAVNGRRIATGQIVDMSLGGIAVSVHGDLLLLGGGEPVSAHFAIPHGLRRFALPAAVVHAASGRLGLHFLPPDDPLIRAERDKWLMVFLLDEQRRNLWRQRVLAGR